MLKPVIALLTALLASAASATTLQGAMTVDDRFSTYISTDDALPGTLIGSGWGWELTYPVSATLTPGTNYYLHVFGEDVGGAPSGFLGSFSLSDNGFSFVNGTQALNSNTTDWQVSRTGFGSGYATPYSHGNNGASPWGNRYHTIASNAQWVWTGNEVGTAYFSTPIMSNVAPVPEPMTALMLLSGLGLLGLQRQRKSQTA